MNLEKYNFTLEATRLFSIEQLGEIIFDKALVTIESLAVLFLCKNKEEKLYLFIERESNQEYEQWIAIEANDDTVNKLSKKELSLNEVFSNKDIYYLVTHLYDNNTYSCDVLKSFPDDVLNMNI